MIGEEMTNEKEYMIDNGDGISTSKENFFESDSNADVIFEYIIKIREKDLYAEYFPIQKMKHMEDMNLNESEISSCTRFRDVRQRKIQRKKRISKLVYGLDWYSHNGQYSKGKIHCGCGLCKFGKSMDCQQSET